MIEHVLEDDMKMMVGVTAVCVKMNLVMMVVTKMVIVVIARSLKIALMIVMMGVVMKNVLKVP